MPVETRYMRNALTENIAYADDYNIYNGSLVSGSLTDLQASDDVYMVFQSELVGTDQVLDVELIGFHSGHMPFLQVRVELHASESVNCEIMAYNYATGSWETTGSMHVAFALGTSDVTEYLYHLLNNRDYRSGTTGTWAIRIRCTHDGGSPPAFTVSIDYLYYRTVAFELGTSNTTSYRSMEQNVEGLQVGIRVWRVNADDTETEITSGSNVATVTGPSSTTTLSATWNCPATSDVVAVVIRVYCGTDILTTADPSSGGLPAVFITEDLNGQLNAATWTVYYAFHYSPKTPVTPSYTNYRFGDSDYNSRIEGFSYGIIVAKRIIGDGLVWIVN